MASWRQPERSPRPLPPKPRVPPHLDPVNRDGHGLTVPRVGLEMQVRFRGVSGVTDVSQQMPGLDVFARVHGNTAAAEVGEEHPDAVRIHERHEVPFRM